jgi:hypothetical protein
MTTRVENLLMLHSQALKKFGRWDSATPGSQRKRLAWDRYLRAEERFVVALERTFGVKLPRD